MFKRERMTILLPHLRPSVTLPHQRGKVLKRIIEAETRGVSTLQLLEAGCMSPQNEISTLRKHGARIETERRDAADVNGEIHKAVAHYTYMGWA